ncbi:hypothetical protein PoB_002852400 [Plakobranchus ocellatus]|uniref:Uncharacterized protein n=1 Tax=Plakobranchus ocellatus TaxID=259542 RepID=A0AAV4A631_9GAST|nr:hypothetical protein PoB_002852400 [Plakobranchus ocellatus]
MKACASVPHAVAKRDIFDHNEIVDVMNKRKILGPLPTFPCTKEWSEVRKSSAGLLSINKHGHVTLASTPVIVIEGKAWRSIAELGLKK